MKRISYVGKKISIGIDVHKNHYTVCCICDGVVAHKATMPAIPEKLVGYIKSRFQEGTVRTAYEAGFSGFVLHRVLESAAIPNLVVHAGSIEVASRDRVKTDKRDSFKLASLLECGRLRGIRVPSRQEEESRLIHRTREQLLRDRTRMANRLRMRLYQFGIEIPKAITLNSLKEILNDIDASTELFSSIEHYAKSWTFLNREILSLTKKLEDNGKGNSLYNLYKTVPGYGVLTASMLSTELGDMKQFSNERKLFSYLGLTPTERSSGEVQVKGHISRQGSSRLRGVLMEAAWAAVRRDPYWKKEYQKRSIRIGGKRAIVSIARRLVGVARSLAI